MQLTAVGAQKKKREQDWAYLSVKILLRRIREVWKLKVNPEKALHFPLPYHVANSIS